MSNFLVHIRWRECRVGFLLFTLHSRGVWKIKLHERMITFFYTLIERNTNMCFIRFGGMHDSVFRTDVKCGTTVCIVVPTCLLYTYRVYFDDSTGTISTWMRVSFFHPVTVLRLLELFEKQNKHEIIKHSISYSLDCSEKCDKVRLHIGMWKSNKNFIESHKDSVY